MSKFGGSSLDQSVLTEKQLKKDEHFRIAFASEKRIYS